MPELATVLTVFGAISPVLLVVVTAILKRRGDRAIEAKTHAEAKVAHALEQKTFAEAKVQMAVEQKTRQEAAGFVLDHATRLVDEFREYQMEKDALASQKQAVAESEINNLKGRVSRMEDVLTRMRVVIATHGVWDAAALIDLRNSKPDYPEPPPLPKSIMED
jgi:hypothetical protein